MLAYLPVRNASFIWDDNIMLTDNIHMLSWDGLAKIWFSTEPHDYFPLTLTSLWIEWRLWGLNPAGYLFVNAFLHAIGAVLLWRVLGRLGIPAAWLIGLLFALHPVAASSVTWVAERKNTLSLVFYAATILFYLRAETVEKNGTSKWYALSVIVFLLALLAKTSVVMVPLLLLGCAWWQRGQVSQRDIIRTAPFFLLSLVFGLITVWFQSHRAIGENAVDIPDDAMSLRLLGGSWGIWFYLLKAVFPIGLSAIYPRWDINLSSALTYMPAAAWFALMAVCWMYRRTWGRPFCFGLGYFFLTLLPILGFFNMSYLMHSRVADHWQYLALIGPLALVIAGGSNFLKHRIKVPRAGFHFLGAALAVTFFALTYRQAAIHSNPEALWKETLRQNPKAWAAHNNLGCLHVFANRAESAETHFREAVRLKPDSPQTVYNLGRLYLGQGNYPEAIDHLSRAARLGPANPQPRVDLGEAFYMSKKMDEAIAAFEEAIRLNPALPNAHNFLGSIFGQRGATDKAIEHYETAIRLRPEYYEAQFNLGFASEKKGLMEKAKKHFSEALRIKPDSISTHKELGKIFEKEGDMGKALYHASRYNYFQAMDFAGKNQRDSARHHLQEAVRLDPNFVDARQQLGLFSP